MKNQYNFLKAIDTSATSSSPEATDKVSSNNSNKLPIKSSFSKLHNLVASKLTNLAPNPTETSNTGSSEQRNGKILSLLLSSGDGNKQQVVGASAEQSKRHFHVLGRHKEAAMISSKPQPSTQTQTQSQNQQAAEMRLKPELAKCYDEIDQIYDYIRGLAPLPMQLRKIKSIDFEQLDREKRLQLEARARQRDQPAYQAPKQAEAARPKQKVRQREASTADEPLREPEVAPPAAGLRVEGPLPIRVTTTSDKRPTVKRVESLNLGASAELRARQRPAYLISSPQRGQLFRLPRAHSTSTLNRATERQSEQSPRGNRPPLETQVELSGEEPKRQLAATTACGTRTLPARKLSQVLLRQQDGQVSNSLGRLRAPVGTIMEPAELVESFVDDDDVSSVASQTSSLSTSSASSSSSESGSSSSHSSSSSSSDSSTSDSDSNEVIESNLVEKKEKWAEKSHSDYENDTTSLSSASRSNLLSKPAGRQPEQRQSISSRRSSSGAGSQTQRSGSRSSSSGAPPKEPARATAAEEHIYEQIPAHKNLLAGANDRPQSVPHNLLLDSSYGAPRQRCGPKAPPASPKVPFNYPVAYAANVASKQQQQQVFLQRHAYPLAPGTYPMQLQQRAFGGLALDPSRRRLSMNNIHLLPYLNQPAVSVYRASEAAAAANKLTRSSSSSKVNRAPRLSPAQLIGQIQMPRAVSKRPAAGSDHFNSFGQHHQPQPLFLWKPAGHAHPQEPPAEARRAGYALGGAAAKRRASRRLTAIGIEQAPGAGSQPIGYASKLAHFEPAQLIKAPLIDDCDQGARADERQQSGRQQVILAHQNRCLNSISDLHSFSSTSAEEEDDEGRSTTSGSPEDDLCSAANRADDSGNFVSSRSFIKCYYGRERAQDPQQQVAPPEPPAKTRANASERLLGLIGIGTNQNKPADNRRSAQRQRNLLTSPIAAMFVAKQQQPSVKRALVGDFLTAEGPILVRDRRISALRSDLVRHYQHPTVQVAKVPGYSSKTRPVDLAGSTNTTNSTSSYEAAIKNSHKSGLLEEPVNEEPKSGSAGQRKAAAKPSAKSGSASGASQALIRVPKLSKQSHLLNRPLPKPPVQAPAPQQQQLSRRANALALAGSSKQAGARPPTLVSRRKVLAGGAAKTAGGLLSQAAGSTRSLPKPAAATPTQKRDKPAGTSSSLSPLAISLTTTHPSPTVTTCTSSGISSNQLASNSSSQRSSAKQRVKSFSELHKQSKRQQQQQQVAAKSFSSSSSGKRNHLALSQQQQSESPDSVGRLDKENQAMTSNLKLFDEKFSSEFMDQQLASSNDSLLESINFMGTFNRKRLAAKR